MDTTTLIRRRTMEQEKDKVEGKKLESHPNSQRLLRVDQIYSRKDRQIHFVKTAKSNTKQAQFERFNKTVLIVRRVISKQGMVAKVEVDIKSSPLADVLRKIFEGVEGLQLNKSPPMADPQLLFHAVPGLMKHVSEEEEKSTPNKSLVNDVSIALDYVRQDFSHDMASLMTLSQHSEITFTLVWTLFPPKIITFTKQNMMSEPQVLEFKNGCYKQRQDSSNYFSLTCQIINHDGEDFGYGETALEINEFEGSRKVHSLAAFPLSAHLDTDNMRAQLIERGRKFVKLLGQTCKDYNGVAVEGKWTLEGSKELKLKFNASGRIMLDPVAFRQQNPWSTMLVPEVYITIDAKKLKEDELLLCNHCILGFSFAKKTWGTFAISKINDILWNEAAFNKLVMDPERRNIIHSLVKSHRNNGDVFDDIVRDKGKGLIGLLLGSPGVGKTLTAEVVAEVTERPLYMISAGELGTDIESVDNHLVMVLEITRRWGCVLLMDEADVFLQSRDVVDLQRNALVSIFLRRLEYFQGILMLTTNRKSAIDAAFQSRIHFTLHLPDLNETSRATIWRNLLDNIPPGLDLPKVSESDIQNLAKMPLNGRQIKNAISCAFSISYEDRVPLTVEGIRTILGVLVDDWYARD